MAEDKKPTLVVDGFSSFEAGMNSGVAPLLLQGNQLSFATNTTIRGSYATHRPPYIKQTLNFGGDAALEAAFLGGLWQAACYYKPDLGTESLVCAISGHLYKLTPTATDWTVVDVSIPGDYLSNVPQVWMWQAEKWLIINDGILLPIYFDGTSSRRSIGNDPGNLNITAGPAVLPAFGATMDITLTTAPAPPWAVGTPIIGVGIGEYAVQLQLAPTQYRLIRTYDPGGVSPIRAGQPVVWPQDIYPEFPPGRCGAYGMGRVWQSLTDGKQFLGGDIVTGPAGTYQNQYRDAVLHTSENTFISGGGYFTTPGAWGDIRSMIFTTTLDTSMGQGPLLVLTPTRTFSCYAPTDRTTWATITNPILTEALISNGAQSFYGTVMANGDCLFRSVDGIRSLVIGRRDFETWGNVPISGEMDRVLSLDVEDLLRYSSAIVFDNRLLMTCGANVATDRCIYHTGLVALNFDPLSSIRGKAPSVYDGFWTGLNVVQLVVGRFTETERGFAFTYHLATEELELYEIGITPKDVFATVEWPPDEEIYDNGYLPILWTGESPMMFKAQDPRAQAFHRLADGEFIIDNLTGTVDFRIYYKPDQYPCWIEWFSWSECAPANTDISKPQFRPRMGVGEPSGIPCDPTTLRPFREGYTFQIKWIITGHCRVLGARFKAIVIPQPKFAPQVCSPPCTDLIVV